MGPDGHDPLERHEGPQLERPAAHDVPASTSSTASFTLSVEASADGPSTARDGIRRWLTERSCPPDVVDDIVLVVSELVTNAVVHARSAARLSAELHDRCVRVEVEDTSSAPPDMQPVGHGVGGYGLRLVATLAEDWGWTLTAAGKRVWSEHRFS